MFAGVVGLGALLMFEVQLVLGKRLLPWYGGASAVWTTCLLFFQAALLGGYAWAHLLAGRLSPRRQRDAHLALLGAALALLAWRAATGLSPITPGDPARPSAPGDPILSILVRLASTIGLPFVVLAATSPLLQAWLARLRPGASALRLFAVSNAGSLLGLVGYPLVVEPFLSGRVQEWLWSAAFAAYAAGVAWCAVAVGRAAPSDGASHPGGESVVPASFLPRGEGRSGARLWLALAFFPSAMLAAVTSHLTQEVAPVPFLWMLPLALYLLSFIVSFAWPDAGRASWPVALAVAAALGAFGLHGAADLGAVPRVALWSAVLFVYGMTGHGELARSRPAPCGLTGYYLAIAAGGALGGLLNAVVAPLAFRGYWELPLGILAGPATLLGARWASPAITGAARQLRVVAAMGLVALGAVLAAGLGAGSRGVERASRGFYGILRVVREERGEPDEYVKLLHGRITHGMQLAAPGRCAELTTYFGPTSGVGLALLRHPKRREGGAMRVGVIGLGVATLAAWSRPGDVFRFYELDPEVARLSGGERPAFSYMREARGDVGIVLGDGRLLLEREAPQRYDVLAVDAFSSDAIPTHLLTRQAFGVYLRHLDADGVLVVHITNRYLDLKPVVRGAAAALGLHAEHVPSFENGVRWSSDWMIVARSRALLDDEVVSAATLPRLPGAGEVVWTDDWSPILRVVKQ